MSTSDVGDQIEFTAPSLGLIGVSWEVNLR